MCVERVGWLMVQGKKNQLKQLLLQLRLTFPLLSLPGHTLSADGIRRIATFDECFVGLFLLVFNKINLGVEHFSLSLSRPLTIVLGEVGTA